VGLSALLHFYNQKNSVAYVTRHYCGSGKHRWIDIFEADVLYGKHEFSPSRRLKSLKRSLRFTIDRVDPTMSTPP
jgi:hypothetical protein